MVVIPNTLFSLNDSLNCWHNYQLHFFFKTSFLEVDHFLLLFNFLLNLFVFYFLINEHQATTVWDTTKGWDTQNREKVHVFGLAAKIRINSRIPTKSWSVWERHKSKHQHWLIIFSSKSFVSPFKKYPTSYYFSQLPIIFLERKAMKILDST